MGRRFIQSYRWFGADPSEVNFGIARDLCSQIQFLAYALTHLGLTLGRVLLLFGPKFGALAAFLEGLGAGPFLRCGFGFAGAFRLLDIKDVDPRRSLGERVPHPIDILRVCRPNALICFTRVELPTDCP